MVETITSPGTQTQTIADPNSLNVVIGVPLPTGDQIVFSRDSSPFIEGSFSLFNTGTLAVLVGDYVMKYWSHNVALDANGNFLGRNDTGPCALITFSEGIGTNAPIYAFWSCPSASAGVVPSGWVKVFSVDLTTGALTSLYTDASGTPGNATINRPRGRVSFVASAQTVVVTNSLVTAASTVMCQVLDSDATLNAVRVTPGAGSFTLTGNATATGNPRCDFIVTS
jgi:hypothetical protein